MERLEPLEPLEQPVALAPLAPLAQQGQLELRVLLELRVQREQLALPEQRVRLEPREAPMGT